MSQHYTEIPSSLSLQWEILPQYDVHKEISARGVSFLSPQELEIATILKFSVKTISMTGSIEFLGKVLKVSKLPMEPLYEVHANFYDMPASKQDETLALIHSIE